MACELEDGMGKNPDAGGMALGQEMRRLWFGGGLGPLTCEIFTCLTINDLYICLISTTRDY